MDAGALGEFTLPSLILEGKTYREMSTEMCCVPKTIDNALQRVKRKIEANCYAAE